MTGRTSISVTFDKAHLTTIGRRLYAESLDLVREIVANAYDADATTVNITIDDRRLTVEDNGSGMDRDGLQQYFTIGSEYKRQYPVSEKFKRKRIGEFGIGKFAVLALCDRFELFTRCDGYAATVIFDREDFEKQDTWEIPVIEHKKTYATNGTRVTLYNLKRTVFIPELERKLKQQLPLTEKKFYVHLNGIRLAPTYIPGRRFRIRQQCEFGSITGEIVVSGLNIAREDVGIAVKVKGMTVRRMFFGLDGIRTVAKNKVTGEINADFLPTTSSRDNFLKDTREWQEFSNIIEKKIKKIIKILKKAKETRETQKADRTLSEALIRVRNALKKNRDIFLLHDLPLFTPQTSKNKELKKAVGEGVFTQKLSKTRGALAKSNKLSRQASKELPRATRNRVKTVLKDKKRLVKRLKIGGVNIVCSLSSLGEDEVESFSEGGVIFINRDHPLFVKVSKNEELAAFNFLRLITKEIILLAKPGTIEQALDWQTRLLTDALVEKK